MIKVYDPQGYLLAKLPDDYARSLFKMNCGKWQQRGTASVYTITKGTVMTTPGGCEIVFRDGCFLMDD